MAAELPDFTGLPGWVQVVLYSSFGISLFVTYMVPRLGFLGRGKTMPDPATATNSAQVVSVIVDPAALNKLTLTIAEGNEVNKERLETTKDLVEVIKSLCTAVNDVKTEMRFAAAATTRRDDRDIRRDGG
jgi:hypothetical protein